MNSTPADAGNVVQQPDPELLRRFEAERDAAIEGQKHAQEKIRAGEEKVRRANQELLEHQRETDRKLCEMGLLPESECH